MKKILALAAVAALTAGVSAYAANPFSDVTPEDWAYQAVSDLSVQGVVEGYPDGTFKGERNMTRYELAQIIARLMAKEDQLNAEQKATLDKLAGEYADELANLGVRVSNLEKKVGNICWSGNARMRYQDKGDGADSWNGRIRINVKGQVNENTSVNGRFVNNFDFKNGKEANTKMDRLYVDHKFGKSVDVKLGRYEVDAGGYNTWLYSAAFDGAEADFNFGKVTLGVGYGRFNGNETTGYPDDYKDMEVFYAQAKANLGVAKLGVDYFKANDGQAVVGEHTVEVIKDGKKVNERVAERSDYEVIGANLLVPFGDFRVAGDYYVNTAADGDPAVWAAGIGYGTLNSKKPGSWALDLAYFDVEKGVFLDGCGGWQLANEKLFQRDGSFWYAAGDVTLQKNVTLHAEYAFAADADKGEDPDDQWTVSLNYKF